MRIILSLMLMLFSVNSLASIIEGNPSGRVTLVEVFDYQCVYCHKVYPTILKLIDKNPDLSVHLMPVAILNHTSLYEAAAAIAATQYPEKSQAFTDIAMSDGVLNNEQVTDALNNLNLNSNDFKKSMHSIEVENELNKGLSYLKSAKSGTPLFIIFPTNNAKSAYVLSGEQPYESLQHGIDQVRGSR